MRIFVPSILLKIAFVLSFLIGNITIVEAQNCNSRSLSNAGKAYNIGNFDVVINELKSCIDNKKFKDIEQEVDACRMLSNTYIAMDNNKEAEIYVSRLIEIRPSFQPRTDDPLLFRLMVANAKQGSLSAQISSVSKVSENLYEAPATVTVITDEQIKNRGYRDLEELVHDLSGFDISRTNGILYSNIYQRGYRSQNTNRMLILIDGIEDNDLWGNIVYLSRQYPISNIKSIEVLYGPASTIYGANAFVGVISINTKMAEEIVKNGERVGVIVDAGYGDYNTKYADATIAANFPEKQISFSVTGRTFVSDENDLSNYEYYDYNPLNFEPSVYNSILNIPADRAAIEFLHKLDSVGTLNQLAPDYNTLFRIDSVNGQVSGIKLTKAGYEKALAFDNTLMEKTEYSDRTETYAINAKLKIHQLTLGWNYWQKEEGLGGVWVDNYSAGANEGQGWNPKSTNFYLRYDKAITNKFTVTAFSRYKVHGYLPNNLLVRSKNYSLGGLGMLDLVTNTRPYWSKTYLTVRSNQVRSEIRTIYRPSPKFNIMTGFETRFSAVQANYASSDTLDPEQVAVIEPPLGGNHFFSREMGVYTQASYFIHNTFKATVGLRYDNNKVRNDQGYGNEINPRIALIYLPDGSKIKGLKGFYFKAMYATAFKDATNFDKWSTVTGLRELNNPNLRPEEVENYEFSVRRVINEAFNVEAVGYYSSYTNIIQSVTTSIPGTASTTLQNQNGGTLKVFGGQATSTVDLNNFNGYINYTFTKPTNTSSNLEDTLGNNIQELRVGDIAKHQINMGGNYKWKNFNFNLRMNWVGERLTGPGEYVSQSEIRNATTVTDNLEDFPAYAIFHTAISYDWKETGLFIQLIGRNLLGTQYYSPGIRVADNSSFSSKVPQNGRNLHLRIRYQF